MDIARSSFWVFVTRIIGLVFAIGVSIITARLLGPEGKGMLVLVLLVAAVCAMVASMGIGMANTYYLGQRKYSPGSIFSHSILLALGSSAIVIVLSLAVYPFLKDSVLKDINQWYILIGLLSVPFALLSSHASGIFLGIKDIARLNLTAIFSSVVGFAFILIALVGLRGGIQGVVIARTSAAVVSMLFAVYLLSRKIPLKFSWNKSLTKDVVSYGAKAQSANIIMFLNYRLDMFLVNLWRGPLQVGYYAIGVAVAEMLWLIPRSVSGVLFSEVSSSNRQRAAEITATMCRHMTFISAVLCIALGLMCRFLIGFVYGEAFLPAVTPLLLLLPGIFVMGANDPTASYISGTGKVIYSPIVVGIMLVINVVLNVLFIPVWGIAGAALASSISYSLGVLMGTLLFFRFSGKNFSDTYIIKRSDLRLYLRAAHRAFYEVRHARENAKIYLGRYKQAS